MNVGTLTLAFHTNYGGILQGYALQQYLIQRGHQPWVINIDCQNKSAFKRFRRRLKRALRISLSTKSLHGSWRLAGVHSPLRRNTDHFVEKHIRMTQRIEKRQHLSRLKTYQLDAYITGSDQIWRPSYSSCLEHYFLDFVENPAKRIAYAASFGAGEWAFSPEQTERCAKLAKRMDAISVRERRAVELCGEHLGVDAEHLIDPTLLLSPRHYTELIANDKTPKQITAPTLATYFLRPTTEKMAVAQRLADQLQLKLCDTMPEPHREKSGALNPHTYACPPLTSWLQNLKDAHFVVTDSFHGSALSSLFNTPFLSFGNHAGGISRFRSLFELLQLNGRLIEDSSSSEAILQQALVPIPWEEVNHCIQRQRERTHAFFERQGL